jgi:hypothetical protein
MKFAVLGAFGPMIQNHMTHEEQVELIMKVVHYD